MLQHFSEHGVRRQIEKSAADMRHDQIQPKCRADPIIGKDESARSMTYQSALAA
jgi:hypothetical protein